jgi:hypothetical protein
MHVEKGVFESTISLLLGIPGKTKDGLSARKDLQTLGIREEIHPQVRPNIKVYLPIASYTLITEEKRAICKCLHGIRVPIGFSTNIKNLVSMLELRILMIAIQCYSCFFPLQLEQSTIHMWRWWSHACTIFFNAISKKVIVPIELDELRKEMRVTMCQLEMCFPPSFFDMMEHYMIHLADQIFVLGPTYMHHMYPYKHHMVIMKGYVWNHVHPKGCMIEGYTTEEIIQCYADYIKDGKSIGVPVSWHHGRFSGNGTKG